MTFTLCNIKNKLGWENPFIPSYHSPPDRLHGIPCKAPYQDDGSTILLLY